jgi:hypothetical protein
MSGNDRPRRGESIVTPLWQAERFPRDFFLVALLGFRHKLAFLRPVSPP